MDRKAEVITMSKLSEDSLKYAIARLVENANDAVKERCGDVGK